MSPRPQVPASIRIGLASFLVLFLELTLIRWIPTQITLTAYFANFILIAAFFGLGAGFLYSERLARLPSWVGPAAWFLLVYWGIFCSLQEIQVPDLDRFFLWLGPGAEKSQSVWMRAPVVLGVTYLLIAAVFLTLGVRLSGWMEARGNPPLAYAWNLLGSLLGILACFFLSLFHSGPAVWFGIGSVLWLTLLPAPAVSRLGMIGCLGMAWFLADYAGRNILWSPYYAIEVLEDDRGGPPTDRHYRINANRKIHLTIVDFSGDIEKKSRSVRTIHEDYAHPYRTFRPEKILVLGAGAGNDLAFGLGLGVNRAHAVEIDPVLVDLGRELNPLPVYSDTRVNVFVDDARSFLRVTADTYDMIVFGTLDSHKLLAGHATVRLDNFVYTVDCFRAALARLAEGGVLVVQFMAYRDWMVGRLMRMMRVAGAGALIHRRVDNGLFNHQILAGPGVEGMPEAVEPPLDGDEPIPTDNWPFFHLKSPGLPGMYWKTFGGVFLISMLVLAPAIRPRAPAGPAAPPPAGFLCFFLLGAGFMLLEAGGITRLNLLYGATWTVSAAVFAFVILALFLAALTVHFLQSAGRAIPISAAFPLIIALLAVQSVIPMSALAALQEPWKTTLAALGVGLPVYLSSVIFSTLLSRNPRLSQPFGANLAGAVCGGLLEYSVLYFGLSALMPLALALYLLAWIAGIDTVKWNRPVASHTPFD